MHRGSRDICTWEPYLIRVVVIQEEKLVRVPGQILVIVAAELKQVRVRGRFVPSKKLYL